MNREKELCNKIKELKEICNESKIGRNQVQKELDETIKELKKCTSKYNDKLDLMKLYYQYCNYIINDYRLLMNIIVRIANENKNNYGIKEIITTDFIKFNEEESKQIYGKCLIVGNNSVLSKIDDKRYYYNDDFSKISSKLVDKGDSLIISSPNYFSNKVKPKGVVADIIEEDLQATNMIKISCFLQDEILNEAFLKVVDYINTNGCDFEEIDEDTLYNLIIENSKDKELVKK